MSSIEVSVDGKRLVRWIIGTCLACELAFVLLDYFVNYGGATYVGPLMRLTNIAREDSLPSWFGSAQTLLAGMTLWCLYALARRRWPRSWRSRGWLVLALFFTYMAVDDGAQLHERFAMTLEEVEEHRRETAPEREGDNGQDEGPLQRFPSYIWQATLLPVFAALGVFLLLFLLRELPRRRSRLLVLAALACLAAAVTLDFFEGLDEDHPWNIYTYLVTHIDFEDYTEYRFQASAFDTLAHFSKSIEETLEMLANTLLWQVFLVRLMEIADGIQLRFLRR